MEIISLVKAVSAILTPALPYLLKIAEKGVEKVGEKIGESTWDTASRIWEKLSPKTKSKAMKEVFVDVASNPSDPLAQSALEYNLRKIFSENLTIAREIEKIVNNSPANFSSSGKNITNVTGTIIDGQIITGDKKVIQHGDYSTIVEKAQIVNIGGGLNRAAEIHPVTIDLRLPNGQYPTYRWIERKNMAQIVTHSTASIPKEWWEPADYSGKRLRQMLMEEVNKWTAQGWEVVEGDLSRVWNSESGSREGLGTALLGSFMPLGWISWEHWEIYYGATFHVRRSITIDASTPLDNTYFQKSVEDLLLKCPVCGLPFKTDSGLNTHMKNWHKK